MVSKGVGGKEGKGGEDKLTAKAIRKNKKWICLMNEHSLPSTCLAKAKMKPSSQFPTLPHTDCKMLQKDCNREPVKNYCFACSSYSYKFPTLSHSWSWKPWLDARKHSFSSTLLGTASLTIRFCCLVKPHVVFEILLCYRHTFVRDLLWDAKFEIFTCYSTCAGKVPSAPLSTVNIQISAVAEVPSSFLCAEVFWADT